MIKLASPFIRRLVALLRKNGPEFLENLNSKLTGKKIGDALSGPYTDKMLKAPSFPSKDNRSLTAAKKIMHQHKLNLLRQGREPFYDENLIPRRYKTTDLTQIVNDYTKRQEFNKSMPSLLSELQRLQSKTIKQRDVSRRYIDTLNSKGTSITKILKDTQSPTTIYKGGLPPEHTSRISSPYWFSGDPGVALHFASRPTLKNLNAYSRYDGDAAISRPVLTIADLNHSKTYKKGKTGFTHQVGPANRRKRINMANEGDVFGVDIHDRVPDWYLKPNFEIVLPGHEAIRMPHSSYIILKHPDGLRTRPWHSADEILNDLDGIKAIPYKKSTLDRINTAEELIERANKSKDFEPESKIWYYENEVSPVEHYKSYLKDDYSVTRRRRRKP